MRNRVTVDGSEVDPATANDSARSLARLAPKLVLTKTANASTASVGERVTYTLRVTNRGPGPALSVRLCDLPGGGLTSARPRAPSRQGPRWMLEPRHAAQRPQREPQGGVLRGLRSPSGAPERCERVHRGHAGRARPGADRRTRSAGGHRLSG